MAWTVLGLFSRNNCKYSLKILVVPLSNKFTRSRSVWVLFMRPFSQTTFKEEGN
jgi:hypothetical protein